MTAAEKEGRSYAGADCTLNSKPAKVIGARLPVATVATLDGEEFFDWSWQAVARIMLAGGRFQS